jgi:hypothetical protein
MEAIYSSETSVHTRSTERHIPKYGLLHTFIIMEELLGNDVFCGSDSRLYNEDYRPAGVRIKGVS